MQLDPCCFNCQRVPLAGCWQCWAVVGDGGQYCLPSQPSFLCSVKVELLHYRPSGLQEVKAPIISRKPGHEAGKVVIPKHRPPLAPLVLVSVSSWIDPREDDTVEDQNRYIPDCSAVPQPSVPPRVLLSVAYPGILFGGGGGSTNSVEEKDRENGDLGTLAP